MIKICKHWVTPSMRCTEIAGHEKEGTNHVSNGAWIELVEILKYAAGVMSKNELENSAQYILDKLKEHDL